MFLTNTLGTFGQVALALKQCGPVETSLLHRKPSRVIDSLAGIPFGNQTRIIPVVVHHPEGRAAARLCPAKYHLFPI